MKNADDLAGGPVVSRDCGNLSIGRDFAAGDRLDRFLNSSLELHRFLAKGNGYPVSLASFLLPF